MTIKSIIGTVICVVGVLILVIAYNLAQAPFEDISNTITGSYSDKITWYFAAGITAIIGGGLIVIFWARKNRNPDLPYELK